jgi:hypothetical protein
MTATAVQPPKAVSEPHSGSTAGRLLIRCQHGTHPGDGEQGRSPVPEVLLNAGGEGMRARGRVRAGACRHQLALAYASGERADSR